MRQSAPGFPTENSVFLMAPVQFLTVETKDENKVSSNPLYAAVDLGSTKVVAVAGHAVDDNLFEVVGLGTSPTGSALRNGTIIGVPQAVTAINRAVDQAQRMAGRPIKHVVVGFAGGEIVGMDQRVTIALRDREVQPSDIEKVLQEARSMINRPRRKSCMSSPSPTRSMIWRTSPIRWAWSVPAWKRTSMSSGAPKW